MSHWDGVISAYREIELDISDDSVESDRSDINLCRGVIGRIRGYLEKNHFCSDTTTKSEGTTHRTTGCVKWLPCHAIDLRKDGVLSPHVDSVRFSGHIVAGLSLQSPSIMRLKPHDTPSAQTYHVDLYLPPLSLYVLSGVSRYNYTHELLSSGEVFHLGQNETIQVDRQDRISIIFRDAPHNTPIHQDEITK